METWKCNRCGDQREAQDLELVSIGGMSQVVCKDGCPDEEQPA
jgi:hypothetical protein